MNAEAAGATLLQGADAIAPVIDRGFVRGAVVQTADAPSPVELRARYVVVADGANSRFGRALGTFRDQGVALRHGHPHVLGDAPPRRALDRVRARREGPQRQPAPRLRLDLPGRRRHA